MKYYLIEPELKKSVIEREHFRCTREDGVVEMLETETGWQQDDVYFELHSELGLTECDNGGNPL